MDFILYMIHQSNFQLEDHYCSLYKINESWNSLVGQQVKDLVLWLLWLKFDPLPGNFHMLWAHQKQKKKNKKNKKKNTSSPNIPIKVDVNLRLFTMHTKPFDTCVCVCVFICTYTLTNKCYMSSMMLLFYSSSFCFLCLKCWEGTPYQWSMALPRYFKSHSFKSSLLKNWQTWLIKP